MEILVIGNIDSSKPEGVQSYILNLIYSILDFDLKIALIGSCNDKRLLMNRLFNVIHVNGKSGYRFLINLLLKAPKLKISTSTIIHAQRPDTLLPFILFHRKNPKICTLHGFINKGIRMKKGLLTSIVYEFIEIIVLKHIDRIITVDIGTKEFYEKKYPWIKSKIILIEVGINTDLFIPMDKYKLREKYNLDREDKLVLFIGRLEKEKNLEFLINSFNELKIKNKKCKLILVGDGRERNNLENLVRKLKLENSIVFKGALDHNKIPEIINCSDVLTICSMYESGPLVAIESLACGIPVVTNDIGRVKEFILNSLTGRIVERNLFEFADAIEELFKEDQEEIQEACRKIAMNLSFYQTAKKTLEVYKSIYL